MKEDIKYLFRRIIDALRPNATRRRMFKKCLEYDGEIVSVTYNRTYRKGDTDTVIGLITWDPKFKYFYISYPYSVSLHYTTAAEIGLSLKWDKISAVFPATGIEEDVWERNSRKFKGEYEKFKKMNI